MHGGPQAKRILLVDDDPDDAELTRRAFDHTGLVHEIQVARDGVDALELLFGTGPYASLGPAPPPDVVLLDLHMPRLDGLGLLRRLRADPRTRYLPVVVLTSSGEEGDVEESYRLGANSYVRKPIDFDDFVDAARQLESYWLELNLPPRPGG